MRDMIPFAFGGILGVLIIVGSLAYADFERNENDPLYVDGPLLSVNCDPGGGGAVPAPGGGFWGTPSPPAEIKVYIESSANTTMTGIIGTDKTFHVSDEQCRSLLSHVGKQVRVFDARWEWGWNWADRVELLESVP